MRLRTIFTAFTTGFLLIGSVWAGVGLSRVGTSEKVSEGTEKALDGAAHAKTDLGSRWATTLVRTPAGRGPGSTAYRERGNASRA
jgi:hypothetical protein